MNLIPVERLDGRIIIANFDLVTHIDDMPPGVYYFYGAYVNSDDPFRVIYFENKTTITTKESVRDLLNKLDYQEPK